MRAWDSSAQLQNMLEATIAGSWRILQLQPDRETWETMVNRNAKEIRLSIRKRETRLAQIERATSGSSAPRRVHQVLHIGL